MSHDDVTTIDARDAVGGIDLHEEVGRSYVRMWGEVDATLRDQASAAMVRCIDRRLPVVVDVSGVTFIDSSGVAFILQVHSVAQDESGTGMVLQDPPPLLVDLLEMIGMGGQIPVRVTTPG